VEPCWVLGLVLWIHETFGTDDHWMCHLWNGGIHVSESESMHCRRLLKHTKIFILLGEAVEAWSRGAGEILFPEKGAVKVEIIKWTRSGHV